MVKTFLEKLNKLDLFSFILWHFDPILGHGHLMWGFAITLIGNTTPGRTPLDE